MHINYLLRKKDWHNYRLRGINGRFRKVLIRIKAEDISLKMGGPEDLPEFENNLGEELLFGLSMEQALFIKDLRVNQGYSWRAVARDVSEKFPELNVRGNAKENYGNQIDGLRLCDEAMCLLGEYVENGWN